MTISSSPYRPDFVEVPTSVPRDGHCPWCKTALQVDLTVTHAVCSSCDARYSTSTAVGLPVPVAPPPSPPLLPKHTLDPVPGTELIELVEAALERRRAWARPRNAVDVASRVTAGVSLVALMAGAPVVGAILIGVSLVLIAVGAWSHP